MVGEGRDSEERNSDSARENPTLLGRLKNKAENHIGWVAIVVAVGASGFVVSVYQMALIPNIERGYQADLKEARAQIEAWNRRYEATRSSDVSSVPNHSVPGLLASEDCPGPSELTGTPGTRQWCLYQDASGNFVNHGPYREWHGGCSPDTVFAGGSSRIAGQPFGDMVRSAPRIRSCVLHVSRAYKRGKLDGDDRIFHANGQPALVGAWREGKRVGIMEKWDRDGNQLTYEIWVDGERHGRATTWHTNGRKAEEGEYRHGKKDGLWIRWDGRGRKEAEMRFTSGIEVFGPNLQAQQH